MKRYLSFCLLLVVPVLVRADDDEVERLQSCREVLSEVMGVPEGIPRDLLQKAHCVAVIPSVKKAALGVGARYGKGAVLCRAEPRADWGPPLMITIGGGSFGFQIGGQATDYVFLIMNRKGIDHLLKSKFTLGADASVAAGPKGRSAEAATDAHMQAEILTYSRSRGVFAGLSLEGAVVKQDKDANASLYGARVDPKSLLLESSKPIPPAARPLVDLLRELSAPGETAQQR
jgi:lipid-binding SYLF domain-containing protein